MDAFATSTTCCDLDLQNLIMSLLGANFEDHCNMVWTNAVDRQPENNAFADIGKWQRYENVRFKNILDAWQSPA